MATGVKLVQHLPALPVRPEGGHKGTFGTVVVIGGSETMVGAPALVALGALRSGAGLVKVAVPRGIVQAVLTIEPGATAVDWWRDAPGGIDAMSGVTAGALPGALERADARGRAVLALGPGMGVSAATGEAARWAVADARPLVLDADGLSSLGVGGAAPRREKPWVMTPHPGEFVRLAEAYGLPAPLRTAEAATDPRTRPKSASALARASGAVVVLKGHQSVVADTEHYFINATGNPAMATAGSGDVLTGAIAALMAQGLPAMAAAALGTHVHGLAGDLWAAEHGRSGMTARDLAGLLPRAFERRRNG